MSILEFSADYFEQIVKIGEEYFLLKEASGEAANKWTDMTSKKTIIKDGQVVAVKNPSETGPYLISLCMTVCDKEGVETLSEKTKRPIRVTHTQIEAWPNRVQKALFKKIVEVSDLDPGDEEEDDADEGKS